MKKLKLLILTFILVISSTGCFKKDNLDNITIYTTNYPIEYLTTRLYGKHSKVNNIYPDGVDIEKYELTDKQIKDYSESSLLIFNGLSNAKNYVAPMLKHNKKMKIIDTALSLDYENYIEELWLNPSNFLMLAQNIKNGLNEYISNHYLKNEINQNYEKLKVEISNLDAKIKVMVQSSNNPTIIVANDTFNFLQTKYNLNVISLEENDNLTDKVKSDVISMIQNNQISYIFTIEGKENNGTVKEIIDATGVSTLELKTLTNLTEKERENKEDYNSLMNYNIEQLKQELYD